jgi:putative Mg2+ transporter-C (MgtC) family protein
VSIEDQLALFGRIAIGALLGFLIGWERSWRGKDAGARTFALLGMGSAGFVSLGIELFPESGDRVIQGVAAGVGFLGAGIIFRASGGTRGLTTAAASWAVAAVGALAGADLLLAAGLGTALVILVLEAHRIPGLRRLTRGEFDEDDGDG